MSTRKKIALIGAGNIGGELAALACAKQLGDVVLFDIAAEGELRQGQGARPRAERRRPRLRRAASPARRTGPTAPAPTCSSSPPAFRASPGRAATTSSPSNLPIIRDVADNAKKHCPDAFVIVISNPLDAMVYEFKRRTGFAQEKVVGMAGVLDSRALPALPRARGRRARSRTCAPWCSAATATTWSRSSRPRTINGVPATQLIAKDKLDAIIERTRKGGGEIVELMGTSAYYAPASSAIAMAEAYLLDQKRLLPCAAYLDGEYGYKDLYMGVPVVIGGKGVEKIVEIAAHATKRRRCSRRAPPACRASSTS